MTPLDEQIADYRRKLQKKLDPGRYEHSLSVSFTCMALAMNYGYDMRKAEIAGILHDCAKHFTDEELILKCQTKGVSLSQEEIQAPSVIHAKYGAWLAEHKYGIQDPEILSAIACHTTGKAGMSILDKILYIADYIEPRRDRAPDLPRIRRLAFQDLDQTMYEILKGTLEYLNGRGASIDPATMDAYQFFEAIRRPDEKGGADTRKSDPDKPENKSPDEEILADGISDRRKKDARISKSIRGRSGSKKKRSRKWGLKRK